MTREEYEEIQARLTKKLNRDENMRYRISSREREAYRKGLLVAKSILHDAYIRGAREEIGDA